MCTCVYPGVPFILGFGKSLYRVAMVASKFWIYELQYNPSLILCIFYFHLEKDMMTFE